MAPPAFDHDTSTEEAGAPMGIVGTTLVMRSREDLWGTPFTALLREAAAEARLRPERAGRIGELIEATARALGAR